MSMIKTLTSWRGIFAICIVCFHFAMHEFNQMTLAGVTFFFMLSGFLVTLKHSDIASTKQFYNRRLSRIFPLHWLVLSAMIALDLLWMHKFHYGWDLPFHTLLLQSWFPQTDIHYNYSIHSWFLSSLLFCIIATPLLIKFLNRLSRKVAWVVVIAACVIVIGSALASSTVWHSYFYVFPLTRVVDYTLGMMLGITMREQQASSKISIAKATAIEMSVLLIFAAFIAIHACGNAFALNIENSSLWWIPISLLIVTSFRLNDNEGLVGKILTLRPLVWLGEISFEVYLMQKLVNNVFTYVIAPFCGHFGFFVYDYCFEGTIPLLIITAWAMHWFFTRKKSKITR